MNKTDLNVLKKLAKDPEVKGKKLLDRVIWLNTTTPKYEVGKLVKVSDPARTICGSKVIDWIGTIEEVYTIRDVYEYLYRVKVKYVNSQGIVKETTVCNSEYKIKTTRAKKDLNYPANTENGEYIDL